jgi:DNA-binding CsgD family transcriptional regulator
MDIAAVGKSLMDAAHDPGHWPRAMDDVSRYVDVDGAMLLPVGNGTRSIPASPDKALRICANDYRLLREGRGTESFPQRGTNSFVNRESGAQERADRSVNRDSGLIGLSRDWSFGIGLKIGSEDWALLLRQGDRPRPVKAERPQKLGELAVLLQQAVLLARSLSLSRAIGLIEGLDLVGQAGLLVDCSGKLFRCNEHARQYLDSDVLVSSGRLSCCTARETSELHKMIDGLCFASGQRSARLRSLVISGRRERALFVQGITLEVDSSHSFGAARALLLIVDPFREREPVSVDDIRRGLGLTEMEAGLLALLQGNVALPQAALRLGIAYETARTHLKNIFNRTDTRRQSEILRLVHNLTGGLRLKTPIRPDSDPQRSTAYKVPAIAGELSVANLEDR